MPPKRLSKKLKEPAKGNIAYRSEPYTLLTFLKRLIAYGVPGAIITQILLYIAGHDYYKIEEIEGILRRNTEYRGIIDHLNRQLPQRQQ